MTELNDELFDSIRRRAYEISQQPDSGTPHENWQRAELELTAEPSTANNEQAPEHP